jgi:hypothetical protein
MSEYQANPELPIEDFWPALPLVEWKDTYATLHMCMQVIGKIRLARSPIINHWWEVPFYLTARGLTTSNIPYGGLSFQFDFDFIFHQLLIQTSEGGMRVIALKPRSVASFYQEILRSLESLGIRVSIWPRPVEVESPVPFQMDEVHRSYDRDYAWRFAHILMLVEQVFTHFRSGFLGKCSPVHFFWGGFDLAVTRFSGRPAPEHPINPLVPLSIVREAYSHEVCSCGFWPGGGPIREAAFYTYAYPEPVGFSAVPLTTEGAFYSRDLGEFILPYERVRQSESPRETLLGFLEETYAAAAGLGGWDRKALERKSMSPSFALAGGSE